MFDRYYVDTPEGLNPLSVTYEEAQDVQEVFSSWNLLPGKLGQLAYDADTRETYAAEVRQ